MNTLNIQKFAKFNANIMEVIKQHTTDDVVDYEKANEALNEQFEKYMSKNQPKIEDLKKEAYEQAQQDFIKGLGIKDVENANQLKAHINSLSSGETEQKLIEANKLAEKWQKDYEELSKTSESTSQELATLRNKSVLSGMNVPKEYVDYVMFEASKIEGETFEDKVKAFSETQPQWFTTKSPSTGYPRNQVGGTTGEVDGVTQRLIDKGRLKP